MDRRIIGRLFLNAVLIAVLISCAKISSPSGGSRDRKPPVVVESTPLDLAKNFRGDKIRVVFDEYVVLDNITDKFMVSPPMKKKPRVLIKGKGVEVEFDEKLKDSTTYTFYFLDAIKDLNEGNILPNYKFVLSTGPVIDSLSVTGNIFKSDNLEIPEKTDVIMYRNLADSAVEKQLPDYISRLDETGYFRIDNVRPGTYRLYGLKESDNSKNYNLPDEEFAFMDTLVTVTSERNYIPPPPVLMDTIVKKAATKNATAVKDTVSTKKKPEPVVLKGEHQLFLFAATRKAHYLTSSRRDFKYQMLYVLSIPPDTMKFDFSIPDAGENTYFTEQGRNRDSIKVWLTDSALYSRDLINTIVRYPFTDSTGITDYKQDTIAMRFTTPRTPKSVKIRKPVFTYESNIRSGFLKPGHTITFNSLTPFREPDTSLIKLYRMEKTDTARVPFRLVRDSLSSLKIYLRAELAQAKNYLFIADSASFGNIYHESADSLGIKFSVKDPETYCKLTFTVENYDGDRIIQLLDKAEKLIAEIFMEKDGKAVFPLLETGIYRAKVIYDLNGDKKWTPGDFATKRQPEPVSYYPSEIELKTGWVLDQTWNIGIKNFKDPKMVEKPKKK
jgi:hypothetical protein